MENKEQIFELIKEFLLNHLTINVIEHRTYTNIEIKVGEEFIKDIDIYK